METRFSHPDRLIQVAAGVICDNGRYLIARRKSEVHLGGFWEFPGGKREPGESLEDCLRRELREELAVSISPPIQWYVIRHDYPEKTVELHFFRCSIVSGPAQPIDCAEVRWVVAEELNHYSFPPADQPIIEALQREGRFTP